MGLFCIREPACASDWYGTQCSLWHALTITISSLDLMGIGGSQSDIGWVEQAVIATLVECKRSVEGGCSDIDRAEGWYRKQSWPHCWLGVTLVKQPGPASSMRSKTAEFSKRVWWKRKVSGI